MAGQLCLGLLLLMKFTCSTFGALGNWDDCKSYEITTNIDVTSIDTADIERKSTGRSMIECITNCVSVSSDCLSVYYFSGDINPGNCYELNKMFLSTVVDMFSNSASYISRSFDLVERDLNGDCDDSYCSEDHLCVKGCGNEDYGGAICLAAGNGSCLITNEYTNIRHYWSPISPDDQDSGIVMFVTYPKESVHSGLRVILDIPVTGNGDSADRCTHWYLTFNGSLCTTPDTIEYLVYSYDNIGNKSKTVNIDGVCYGLPAGDVKIDVMVGTCEGLPTADAYTGYESGKSMQILEVPSQQLNDETITEESRCASAVSFNYKYATWNEEINEIFNSSEKSVLIKNITHRKLADDTFLRIKYSALIGFELIENQSLCAQWSLMIDGAQCSSNHADIQFSASGYNKIVYWRKFIEVNTLEAICETELTAGEHTIGIYVGYCSNTNTEDQPINVLTGGFNSPSRIHIDEVRLNTNVDVLLGQGRQMYRSATSNIQQWTWERKFRRFSEPAYLTNQSYTKVYADTALRLTASGTARLLMNNDVSQACVRWYFSIDDIECDNPGPVDSMMMMNIRTKLNSPMHVNGLCYGVGVGNHTLEFRVGTCPSYANIDADVIISNGFSFHIFSEELRVDSRKTCASGIPADCDS